MFVPQRCARYWALKSPSARVSPQGGKGSRESPGAGQLSQALVWKFGAHDVKGERCKGWSHGRRPELVAGLIGFGLRRVGPWLDRHPDRDFSQATVLQKIGRLVMCGAMLVGICGPLLWLVFT